MTCRHRRTEPVTVLDRTVAQVCADCLAPLPAEYGCDDCEFVMPVRRLCQVADDLIPMVTHRCEEHS